jgi:hypothetical protein
MCARRTKGGSNVERVRSGGNKCGTEQNVLYTMRKSSHDIDMMSAQESDQKQSCHRRDLVTARTRVCVCTRSISHPLTCYHTFHYHC